MGRGSVRRVVRVGGVVDPLGRRGWKKREEERNDERNEEMKEERYLRYVTQSSSSPSLTLHVQWRVRSVDGVVVT